MNYKSILRHIAGIIILVFIAGGGFFHGCTDSSEKSNDPPKPDLQIPNVQAIRIVSKELRREVHLPGEIGAYQDVGIYPKVEGFVDKIFVDRGSVVKRGALLTVLVAPELTSRKKEADAKARSAKAQLEEASAKLSGSEDMYSRLKAASFTPGVVAGNDLEIAQRTKEADGARVEALKENEEAALNEAQSIGDIEAYLRVAAPFDGIITERNVHEGSFAGHGKGTADLPMVRIQEVARLRLTIYVPENETSGIVQGITLEFTVPAYPNEKFKGVVRRVAHALDVKTRTMPVELDVDNKDGRLAPGMYAEVTWIVQRPNPSLFVPSSAIVNTTERSFVICIRDGQTAWVNVEQGFADGNLVEIFGNLSENETIVLRGTDELREGIRVNAVENAATKQ